MNSAKGGHSPGIRTMSRILGLPALTMGFPGGSVVKNLLANAGEASLSLGQEDPLEEEMATHSSILAWEIAWTEEPGRLQPLGSQVRHDLATKPPPPPPPKSPFFKYRSIENTDSNIWTLEGPS